MSKRIINILLLFIRLILSKIYELNEDYPSLALHGRHFDTEKEITLIGCQECDYLIDFSRRDCLNFQPIQAGQRKSPENVFCYDPLPISINQQILSIHDCPGILPYDADFKKCLYSCTYEFKNVTELRVNLLENDPLEFAISFRIKKWVDATKTVLVIPSDPKQDVNKPATTLSIRPNTLAILVRHPIDPGQNNSQGPKMQARIVRTGNYLPDIDCKTSSTFFAYPGSPPGSDEMIKKYLIDFDRARMIEMFTTVTTIYTNESCTFAIEAKFEAFKFNPDLDEGLYTNAKLPVNSFGFPWIFDDSSNYNECQNRSYLIGADSQDLVMMNISIIRQQGGFLEITAYEADKHWRCVDGKIISEYTSNEDNWEVRLQAAAYCIKVNWCPTKDLDNHQRGFFLIFQKYANVINEDAQVYTPSLDGPPVLLNFLQFNNIVDNGPMWIRFEDECVDCEFLIDLSRICRPISETEPCPMNYHMEINEMPFVPQDCEISYRQYTDVYIQRCQFRQPIDFSLYYNLQQSIGKDVMSIRVVNKSNSSSDYYNYLLETEDNPSKPITYKLEKSSKPTWLTICYRLEGELFFLDKLRSDRGAPVQACEYTLIDGAPPGLAEYKDRIRMVFRDVDPFVAQYVAGPYFSVLIPAGCTPSFKLIDPPEYVSACEGTISVATQAKIEDWTVREDRYDCDKFLLNITVEVSILQNSNVTFQFFDVHDEEIKNDTAFFDAFNGNPQKFTVYHVRGVHVLIYDDTRVLEIIAI